MVFSSKPEKLIERRGMDLGVREKSRLDDCSLISDIGACPAPV
jgi:hypothetical protein